MEVTVDANYWSPVFLGAYVEVDGETWKVIRADRKTRTLTLERMAG